jgi:hypothetical protein
VPPEYLGWGAPPPTHFIDAWMGHLGHPYSVGILSAAAHHGIAHHAVQVFQVATAARLRDRIIGRAVFEFVRAVDVATIVTTAMTGGRFDAARLVATAATYRPAVLQRLGYVAETGNQQTGLAADLEPVARRVAGLRVVPLDVRGPRSPRVAPRWRVQLNADVVADT